jgi:hypothetical protein
VRKHHGVEGGSILEGIPSEFKWDSATPRLGVTGTNSCRRSELRDYQSSTLAQEEHTKGNLE